MSAPGRLSTCGVCGGTITNERGAWQHVKPGAAHRPEPDDSFVSGPDADDLDGAA